MKRVIEGTEALSNYESKVHALAKEISEDIAIEVRKVVMPIMSARIKQVQDKFLQEIITKK